VPFFGKSARSRLAGGIHLSKALPLLRTREPYALCLPLLTGSGEVFGFLSLNRKDRAFSDEETVSAQLLAWEVAFRLGEKEAARVSELERGMLFFLDSLSEDVASILRRIAVATYVITRAPLLAFFVPFSLETPPPLLPLGRYPPSGA
jgi:hypothetical protein